MCCDNDCRRNLAGTDCYPWATGSPPPGIRQHPARPVDASDFTTYIFPLLFFKRICDVWDEEYQEIVDEAGDEQLAWFPELHRFQIPED